MKTCTQNVLMFYIKHCFVLFYNCLCCVKIYVKQVNFNKQPFPTVATMIAARSHGIRGLALVFAELPQGMPFAHCSK